MRLASKTSSNQCTKVAGIFMLSAALGVLVGCQGFSTGASSKQQPTQSGSLSFGASSLNFGSVTAGSSKSLTVTATNSGTQPVTVSSATLSTGNFSLASPGLPVTIAAGQSTNFTVRFAPNAVGPFSGTIAVASDASNPSSSLALTGSGVSVGQMTMSPSSQDFGSLTVGASQSQTVTLTNAGGSSVSISQASVSGAGFQLSGISTPLTLGPSQSTTFTVAFAPQTAGSASGVVTITSDASNSSLTMGLTGTGLSVGAVGASPTSLGFDNVSVGNKQTLPATITNTGGSSVTVSQVGITGAGFTLSGISAPLTLAAGQSANFNVSFTPQSAGSASGSVTITSTASNSTLNVPVSGTGTSATGQLAVSPGSLSLGDVVVGTSGSLSGSLTASGASVTVTAAGTNNSVFSVGGLSLPVTIPAGQSASFTVTFSPQVTGSASASLIFASNAQPSTTAESLGGTGIAAPTHSVNLSWDGSSSSDIAGYNIYRAVYGSSCGSYVKINPVLNTTTLYTDSTVADGSSYCYASTAVNSSSEESPYSNIVSNVRIPAQ